MARDIRSPFVRREELDGLPEELAAEIVPAILEQIHEAFANIEARVSVIERALESVIEDLEIITGVAEPEPEPEPDYEPPLDTETNPAYGAEHRADGHVVDSESTEESPEEEAARLRWAAIESFERDNEVEPEPATDFNDVPDVPEDGRNV